MGKPRKFECLLVVFLLAVVGVGCDRDLQPDLAPATGTVTYHNVPVEGAKIVMHNSRGMATAVSDEEGKFEMVMVVGGKEYRGAPRGTLSVAVSKTKPTAAVDIGPIPGKTASEEEIKAYRERQEEASMTQANTAPPRSVIPEKYANPQTSGLQVELTEAGMTDIEIVLSDD